ncbi:MAG: phosphomannomutase/phosphoglucomutase [Bacteroidetes bacterium]|nr:phosphomannomutase/phosphoglucomutase [Bacteroidota bacterium]
MNAFKAYDIRGIYNEDFNKSDVYRIGFFLPSLLKADKVLVGRDVRASSPEIFEYLCKGITDSGIDVYDIGLSTTPLVYWATARFGFDASVMITASHNPKEYNGLKISRSNALPVGLDSGLGELKKLMETADIIIAPQKGKIIEYDIKEKYLDFQRNYLSDISNLNISMDCSNGMAALLIKDILGNQPHYIFDELDGSFPNHEANPLEAENIVDLQHLVAENKSDIGVIFDGDADRVMFVDENSKFISPDLIIGLLSHYFLEEKGLKGNVLQDIRTSKAVGEYIRKFGSEIYTWKVGRAYAALKLREIDGIYGGELAGHYYFKDFYYSDSGILACLLVLDIVAKFKRQGIKLSEAIAGISKYANSGEINFRIEQKQEAMDAIRDHFSAQEKPLAYFDFDGYRVEFKDWWFNVRPSNTEPYLRFLAEAINTDLLETKVAEVNKIISAFR